MKDRRMVGPFTPFTPEVEFLLHDSVPSLAARCIYHMTATVFPVEEDWDVPGEWVHGTITATKKKIQAVTGIRDGGFFKAWPELVKVGLVRENGDGTFTFLMFKKKEDETISPKEVNLRLAHLEKVQDEAVPAKEVNMRLARLEKVLLSMEKRLLTEEASLLTEESSLLTEESSEGRHLLSPIEKDRVREEEEEEEERVRKNSSVPITKRNTTKKGKPLEPGSRDWIIMEIVQLWPARGFKPADMDAIEILETHPVASLETAFAAARDAKVLGGNLQWLINGLNHPEFWKEGELDTDGKSESRRPSGSPRKRDNSRGAGKGRARSKKGGETSGDRLEGKRWPTIE